MKRPLTLAVAALGAVATVGAGPSAHADPGQPLTFAVSDHLFTAELTGYCLWQRG
jgi:hypothetical protein